MLKAESPKLEGAMAMPVSGTRSGQVASLHLHPATAGEEMARVLRLELVAGEGIAGNSRYFGRRSQGGQPSRRQVSLMEREQIAEHAATLGLAGIDPGLVRANIETEGLSLAGLVGREIQIGTALLRVTSARTPCHKMDRIAPGLRELMENGKQGVMAEVVASGLIEPGMKVIVRD